jgi:outer membrane receptor protein involved in Fe transport
MALLCALCLAVVVPRPAEAADSRFDFNLPAGRLEQALQSFNEQSGASAGMAGALPAVQTRAVKGRYTAREALRRMLTGTGVEAVAVGQQAFRLQPRMGAAQPAPDAEPQELDEVLVTATKRRMALVDLPVPITVVGDDRLGTGTPLTGTLGALDFDAATSSTNLGPGRNRHFIRGVADSAFLGPSQATVTVQFDETRLNYSAPDPDLRLLDIERVEVLKGPQGPLYGTGALGGVVHILPQRPDLDDASFRMAAFTANTAHGGFSTGGSGVLNVPLVPDSLALRTVAYIGDQAGWIDNLDGRDDANGMRVGGGRVALRALQGVWMFDVQGGLQHQRVRDSQYVTGDGDSLARSDVLPEPRENELGMASVVARGQLWGGELTWSSSYVKHEVNGMQDASAAAALFGVAAPARYADDRSYRLVGHELRYSGSNGERIAWLAGIAYLNARNHISGSLDPAPAGGATVQDLRQRSTDFAVFGESDVDLPAGWGITTGLRLARVADEDEALEATNPESRASVVHTATPSLTLDWQSTDRRVLTFLRYAQAKRPGGLNPDGGGDDDEGEDEDLARFRADRLASIDAGLRLHSADDAFALQAGLFATRWRNVQSDYLQGNGLIGTRNVGNARNYGIEAQLRLSFDAGWSSEFGTVLQRARLRDPVVAVAKVDPRMPVVPDVRLYAIQAREFTLGGWQMRAQLRGDFTGSSRLSFDADLDRDTPSSFTLAAAATARHGPWDIQLSASNLLDSRADTFAFGNPFSIRNGPQRTPRQPRTLSLQVGYGW